MRFGFIWMDDTLRQITPLTLEQYQTLFPQPIRRPQYLRCWDEPRSPDPHIRALVGHFFCNSSIWNNQSLLWFHMKKKTPPYILLNICVPLTIFWFLSAVNPALDLISISLCPLIQPKHAVIFIFHPTPETLEPTPTATAYWVWL